MILAVAGEPSGDALAASVLDALPCPAVGVGGGHMQRAGCELLADCAALSGNGIAGALGRVPAAARVFLRIRRQVELARPQAALLVDATEFNARLGRWLRARGVPVLWCVAPQTWAWRPERGPSLARAMDRLAALFSFEVPLWRRLGVDARWVGHPALDRSVRPRAEARAALGLPASGSALALLPGSRPGEVRRLLPAFLAAASELRRRDGLTPVLLLAPSLPARLLAEATRQAHQRGLPVRQATGGLGAWLAAFDVALCASGTASLECALAAASPVVSYRVDALTAWAARRWLLTPHIGLPNVLLRRRAYPELLQEQLTPSSLIEQARSLLTAGPDHARALADELRFTLDPGDGNTFGKRAASLLLPWIEPHA